MIKTIIYLGLQDKDTKQVHFTLDFVQAYLADMFSEHGATIQRARGLYKYDDNTIANEPTFIITLFDRVLDKEFYKRVIKELKNEFNQESILIERSEVVAQFV